LAAPLVHIQVPALKVPRRPPVDGDVDDGPIPDCPDAIGFETLDRALGLEAEVPDGPVDKPPEVMSSIPKGPTWRAKDEVRSVSLFQDRWVCIDDSPESPDLERA
jgi:hypothetical protein